ncbi:Suppressor of Profilin deletion [Coemansia sp. RSA 1200]|nr:Suppressor of Profilin deletion [Coemansia sp. RSA 1200]
MYSIPPATLADELAHRYNSGTNALQQLIDHFSQRARLEEAIASTIEKAPVTTTNRAGTRSFVPIKFVPSNANDSSVEINVLLPHLQREAEHIIRMHLHLSKRLVKEVVVPLEGFILGEAWEAANHIQGRLQTMAASMHAYHDEIPKISARTISKSARASQQAKQRLEEKKDTLMALQNEWQSIVPGLVAQFEAADVARVEAIREALMRFEHYRNEFFKAAQDDISSANELTQQYQPNVRISAALDGRSQSQPSGVSNAEHHNDATTSSSNGNNNINNNSKSKNEADKESVSAPSNASSAAQPSLLNEGGDSSVQEEAPQKSFLKLNIFRSKTKRVKKKSSGSGTFSGSSISTDYSRSISSGIVSPGTANTNPGISGSIRTTNTHDSSRLSPRIPGEQRSLAPSSSYAETSHQAISSGSQPQSPSQRQHSIQPSSPLQKPPHMQTGTGDFAEWVFTDNTQETSSSRNDSNYSVGSMVHVSNSLAAIDEASDSSQQRSQHAIDAPKKANDEGPGQPQIGGLSAKVDDAFGPLNLTSSPIPEPLSAGSGEHKQADLDSAFNIPLALPAQAKETPAEKESISAVTALSTVPKPSSAGSATRALDNTKDISFDDVFDPADVFKPTGSKGGLKKSPQVTRLGEVVLPHSVGVSSSSSSGGGGNKHRRSVSTGSPELPPTHAKGVAFDTSEKPGAEDNDSSSSGNNSDGDEDADNMFRVKFSIRENAIKDNPDESKAALSRVATLLRSVPPARRGRNRRDVRTMYVPSSLLVTSALESQDLQNSSDAKAKTNDRKPTLDWSDDSDGAVADNQEQTLEPAMQDNDVPITPMPVRPATGSFGQVEALDNRPQPGDSEEMPVPTETALDTPAAIGTDSEPTHAVVGADSDIEAAVDKPSTPESGSEPESEAKVIDNAPNQPQITKAPDHQADDKMDTPENPVPADEHAHNDNLHSTVVPDAVSVGSEPNDANVPHMSSTTPAAAAAAEVQAPPPIQKSEGSGRRRAPPPPPSVHSLRPQTSSASLASQASRSLAAKSKIESVQPPPVPANPLSDTLQSAFSPLTESKSGSPPAETQVLEQQQQNQQQGAQEAPASLSAKDTGFKAEGNQQLTSSKSVHRGRRAGASTRPMPITMAVREIIDYELVLIPKPDDRAVTRGAYQITGEVSMHIHDAINPLELAPLRVCIKKAENGMELVANPSVAVLDASFTATMADGRDWYRFVRPNLFAQVQGPEGTDVVVFKYVVKGVDEAMRFLPLAVTRVESYVDGLYGLMAFYEASPNSIFAGATLKELALMLSISGKLELQASRPTANWYQEHNRLLWKLDDLRIPTAEDAAEDGSGALSKTLAIKARGEGPLSANAFALKYVAEGFKIVDTALCIARVSAGSNHQQSNPQAPVAVGGGASALTTVVIDGPASCTIKSGKVIYKLYPMPPEPVQEAGMDDNDTNDKRDVPDGKSSASSESSEEEEWASGENDSKSNASKESSSEADDDKR